MVEVVNRQRACKVRARDWSKLGARILEHIGREGSSATIAFVSDRKSKELNKRFRGVDRPTDVLSFRSEDEGSNQESNLGDIAVSVETARRQAKANKLTLEGEIAQLILHGLLHLCGYDHETDNGEMNRLELRLRRDLKL